MVQQDVCYYFNGLLFDLCGDVLCIVVIDGYCLVLCEIELVKLSGFKCQIIVLCKGVIEFQCLLESGDCEIELEVGCSYVCVKCDDVIFIFKLIDGCFLDYEVVILIGVDCEVKVDCEVLCVLLQCVVILFNEKYRGICVEVLLGNLKISVYNLEQEEVQEEIEVDIMVSDLVIGFNVNYLLDVFFVLCDEEVIIQLCDFNFLVLVCEFSSEKLCYVVMLLCF